MKTGQWLAIATVLVIVALAIFARGAREKSDPAALTTREVAFLCTTDMATAYHIHPELAIRIDGADVPIPPNIGIKPTCMTSIHTHDGGGIIHVESPIQKDFTLGDFFAVWEKDFSRDSILGNVAGDEAVIVVSVNGVAVETYEETILGDGEKILISYNRK